jgi:hypothetical protein
MPLETSIRFMQGHIRKNLRRRKDCGELPLSIKTKRFGSWRPFSIGQQADFDLIRFESETQAHSFS